MGLWSNYTAARLRPREAGGSIAEQRVCLVAELLHGGEGGFALVLRLGVLESCLDFFEALDQLVVPSPNILRPHDAMGNITRWGLGRTVPLRHGP